MRRISCLAAMIAAAQQDGILRGADHEFLFHIRHNVNLRLFFGVIRDANRPRERPPKTLGRTKNIRPRLRPSFWCHRVTRGK